MTESLWTCHEPINLAHFLVGLATGSCCLLWEWDSDLITSTALLPGVCALFPCKETCLFVRTPNIELWSSCFWGALIWVFPCITWGERWLKSYHFSQLSLTLKRRKEQKQCIISVYQIWKHMWTAIIRKIYSRGPPGSNTNNISTTYSKILSNVQDTCTFLCYKHYKLLLDEQIQRQ